MSSIKAQRGIKNIEEHYRQVKENKEQGDEGGNGKKITETKIGKRMGMKKNLQ